MRWRTFTSLITTVSGLAVTLAACAPTTPIGGGATTSSTVTVTQTVAADQSAPCRDAKSSLITHAASDAATFVVTIDVTAPLCTPLDAKAVVWAMAGNGQAWPQELVQAVPFTLSEAATVTVTFTKGCGAAQFDVITGATPQTIRSGAEHGPLIDPVAAQQWWGEPCTDPTTTTEATTTTTEATTTTTEATTTTTSTTVPPTTTTTSTTTTTAPPTTTTTSTTVPPTTTTTSTTTTTQAPRPDLVYTGTADKTAGCYSGAAGDDTYHQLLGSNGWWDFYFQGCSAFATETVALDDPPSGPFADSFQAPTGYKCRMSIDGTSDGTGYYTNQVGSVADTGGLIFLQSASSFTSNWDSPTTWRITCTAV